MMMVPILLLLFLCGYEADAEMQLPGGHKIKAFEGNTTQVLVSFTKAYPELLTAVISSDISITINGTINTLHNNGSVNITPSDINTLDYGTYKIEFHLYGNGSNEQVDAVLFYEKSLSGLTEFATYLKPNKTYKLTSVENNIYFRPNFRPYFDQIGNYT